jgi:hypothetical protein
LNDNRERQQHFEKALCDVFDALNHLMKDSTDSTLVVHEAILTHLPTITADVIAVYNPVEFWLVTVPATSALASVCTSCILLEKMFHKNADVRIVAC